MDRHEHQPPGNHRFTEDALTGADVFIGVSAPGLLTGTDIATMADRAIVFALSNPDPEVDPAAAAAARRGRRHRTQRLPQPDQQRAGIPRILRGLLDAGAHEITDTMLIAPRTPSPTPSPPKNSNPTFIVPSVFDPPSPQQSPPPSNQSPNERVIPTAVDRRGRPVCCAGGITDLRRNDGAGT